LAKGKGLQPLANQSNVRFKLDLLHPKQVTGLHRFHALQVLSMVYMDSGRLLPLTADGAGTDFTHSSLHTTWSCHLGKGANDRIT
jgi:hypothetical protein